MSTNWPAYFEECRQRDHDNAIRQQAEDSFLAQQRGLEAGQMRATERAIIEQWRTRRCKPTLEPEPGSDEEIGAIEAKLNAKNGELSEILMSTRFDSRMRDLENGNLEGFDLVRTQQFLAAWGPRIGRLRREVADLSSKHRSLLAARRIREREHPTPPAPELPPRMLVPFHGLYYGL